MHYKEPEISKLISSYAKGTLSNAEKEQLDKWLKTAPNRALFTKALDKEQILRKSFEYDNYNQEKAWQALNKKIFRPKLYLQVLKYAAAILLPLLLGIGVLYISDDSKPELAKEVVVSPGVKKATLFLSDGSTIRLGEEIAEIKEQDGTRITSDESLVKYIIDENTNQEELYNEVIVKRGEEFQLVLSDGTKVWINSMSSIKFPVNFKSNLREVSITGEVCFDVTHNSAAPFIVHTPLHDIEVLGTFFNVSCYEDDEIVKTTLVDGSIEISNVVGGIANTVLTPNLQFLYNKQELKSSVKVVEGQDYIAWTQGYFKFREKPLYDIFKQLRRWYHVDIFYANSSVKEEVFTGSLPRFEDIQTILKKIERVSDVEFEISEEYIVVK